MTDHSRMIPRRIRARRRLRPTLMVLEDRTMLATLMVKNTNDSGTDSLRTAIGLANTNDTITFDPALFTGAPRTITLTSGTLNIAKVLTIQGPGASQLTVSGNSGSKVFN